MPPKKRQRFDPETVKRTVKVKRDTAKFKEELEGYTDVFVKHCSHAPNFSILASQLQDCAELSVELFIVASVGLKGLHWLHLAHESVPGNYPGRISVITSLVNSVLSSPISEEKCKCLLTGLESTSLSTINSELEADGRWHCAIESGLPVHYLTPPVTSCIRSGCVGTGELTKHHDPIIATVFTLSGPEPASKQLLKCGRCACIYGYSMYGYKAGEGERFYNTQRQLIEVSDNVFCHRSLFDLFCNLSLHCWVSFSGFAEVYFEQCFDSTDLKPFSVWHSKHNSKGNMPELTRKHVSDMYFNGELELEIRNPDHPHRMLWSFKKNDDKEIHIEKIVAEQMFTTYHHTMSPSCISRGCDRCFSMDGNWKLCFTHCMFPVTAGVTGLPTLNIPDVCPRQLKPGSAFCDHHHAVAQELNCPTNIRGFLSFCGVNESSATLDQSESDLSGLEDIQVNDKQAGEVLHILQRQSTPSEAVLLSQGTSQFLQKYPSIAQVPLESDTEPICRKDIGDKQRLRLWSRGHLFIVRSCGHICIWRPIFRSESPSQVFLIVIYWLFETLKSVPVDKWPSVVLAYDNMCHLDSLKAARQPLPLPSPYDEMWLKITKVIDSLHIANHKDPKCHTLYHPKKAKEAIGSACNLMVAEQTFSWLSRYKKIINSMPRNHHLFFLHRTVCRRNVYTETCQRINRKPLLPKNKSKSK